MLLLEVEKNLLGVANMSAIALSEREQQFLVTHSKFSEEELALPLYVSSDILVLGSPQAHTIE